jgi:hypothetical protein
LSDENVPFSRKSDYKNRNDSRKLFRENFSRDWERSMLYIGTSQEELDTENK